MMSEVTMNLKAVQNMIQETAVRVQRDPSEVLLVAVSKTKPVELIQEAYDAGIRDFGENKVQELCEKMEVLPADIHWHMIGHLQRNKVKYIVGKVTLIHSVDSLRLAEEISRIAQKQKVSQDILVEVNMGREESKFGVMPEGAEELIRQISLLPGVKVCGIMTSAPYVVDFEENREIFHKMRQLSVDIDSKNIDNVSMDILSMGMSQDYVAAIEEGATMIRVGSKIFGQRYYGTEPKQ